MTARQLHIATLHPDLAALLALYERMGESKQQALLKAMQLRAGADGYLNPDGSIKRGVGRMQTRRTP